MIKNTLRADAIMMLTLETTMNYDVWDTIDNNAILWIRKRKKKYR